MGQERTNHSSELGGEGALITAVGTVNVAAGSRWIQRVRGEGRGVVVVVKAGMQWMRWHAVVKSCTRCATKAQWSLQWATGMHRGGLQFLQQ